MSEIRTCTIYLDAAGDVLACAAEMEGHTTVSLAEFQATEPTCTERIPGGPLGLRRLRDSGTIASFHHRKTGGQSGTDLSHYTTIAGRPAGVFLPVLSHAVADGAITDPDWLELGGVVLEGIDFARDASALRLEASGRIRSVGSGVELRLVSGDPPVPLNTAPYAAPDTADVPIVFTFVSDQPLALRQELYRLQGRLGAATSGSITQTSLRLRLRK